MKKPGFLAGAQYFLRGISLINTPGLRRFVIIPLSINIILFSLAIWFGIYWVDAQIDELEQFISENTPASLQWLADLAEWLKWILIPLAILVMLAIMFYTFALLANLIAAPFNSLLADQIEAHLTGSQHSGNSSALYIVKDIGPSLLSELRKLLYFLIRAIPLLMLFIIPALNIVAGLLWFIFSAWMLVIEYNDYPMGNHSIRFPDQRQALKSNRFFALGFGATTMAATMIPIINFITMPAAVAGSTAMWVDYWKDNISGISIDD